MEFSVSPHKEEKNYATDKPQKSTAKVTYSFSNHYLARFRQDQADLLRFLPATTERTFPKNGNEGLYGWTHRHKSGIINIQEGLKEERHLETRIHESIHTPDEYETRRITEWIMSSLPSHENSYKITPPSYTR